MGFLDPCGLLWLLLETVKLVRVSLCGIIVSSWARSGGVGEFFKKFAFVSSLARGVRDYFGSTGKTLRDNNGMRSFSFYSLFTKTLAGDANLRDDL